jgi:hypothetical protein
MNVMSVRNAYSPKLRILAEVGLWPLLAWIIPVGIVWVILERSCHNLACCLIKMGGLRRPLVLLGLLLKYEMTMFFLEIKEGTSRESNMEDTPPNKN